MMLSGSKPTVAIMQAGGPTAVFNMSVHGFCGSIEGRAKTLAVRGGPRGLVAGELDVLDVGEAQRHAERAGAVLGAGRYPMGDEEIALAAENLQRKKVDVLVLLGGNGTMELGRRLSLASKGRTRVLGIPKTVDNDILETDRAPGYLSAASFVANTVRDLGDDQRAMGTLEDVRLVETIGRNVGWVALASLLARVGPGGAPHLVYVPEQHTSSDDFLVQVERTRKEYGPILVVVSEGCFPDLMGHAYERSNVGKPLLGGVVHILAKRLHDSFGYSVRPEVLGMIQRSCTSQAAYRDRRDAWSVGRAGAEAAVAGVSDQMVALLPRQDGAGSSTCLVPLDSVAGRSKLIPEHFLPPPDGDPVHEFRDWLRDLLRQEGTPSPN